MPHKFLFSQRTESDMQDKQSFKNIFLNETLSPEATASIITQLLSEHGKDYLPIVPPDVAAFLDAKNYLGITEMSKGDVVEEFWKIYSHTPEQKEIKMETSDLRKIKLLDIQFNPYQPRFTRDADINSLKESISTSGLNVPISVIAYESKYILIDGERRFRACLELGHEYIDAIVKPYTVDSIEFAKASVSQIQTEQFDPVSRAMAILLLKEKLNDVYPSAADVENEIERVTGFSPTSQWRYLKVYNFCNPEMKTLVAKGDLSMDMVLRLEDAIDEPITEPVWNTISNTVGENYKDKVENYLSSIQEFQTPSKEKKASKKKPDVNKILNRMRDMIDTQRKMFVKNADVREADLQKLEESFQTFVESVRSKCNLT